MPSERILVTGASGFIGRAVVEEGVRRGLAMLAVTRAATSWPATVSAATVHGGLNDGDWAPVLVGASAVIHCAARLDVIHKSSANPLTEFRCTNVTGSVRLAEQAAAAGVRRFVLVSSIKVNGESTLPGRPFTEEDLPSPADPYGLSKLDAEKAVLRVAARTGLEVVVVRPPLVYGPGVKGNFAFLAKWIRRGWPLPFSALHNQRSLIALGNLVDLLLLCTRHLAARGETFLAADGKDVSIAELCRGIGAAVDRPVRLFPVPTKVFESVAKLAGRQAIAKSLCSSLQVDASKVRARLGWSPPLGLDEGLRLAVEGAR
jgi:UDP-glucose 4-epimerase